jgi:hypothetical protein
LPNAEAVAIAWKGRDTPTGFKLCGISWAISGATDRTVGIRAPGARLGHSGADQRGEKKNGLDGVEHLVNRRVELNKAMNLGDAERNVDVMNGS